MIAPGAPVASATMPPSPVHVAVTYPGADLARIRRHLGDNLDVTVTAVADLAGEERRRALRSADALLVWHWRSELPEGEARGLPARMVQLLSAGADHVPFDEVPAGAVLASNAGAYAEPMAEHVLAMVLASVKDLRRHHDELARGEWCQQATGTLAEAVCAVVGYGGIGRATARLLRAMGASIWAVNTSGHTEDEVAFAGTLADLPQVLATADVVVLSVPLTRATRGLIGPAELASMKADAILVNVARGAIVDQDALYAHLVRTPTFRAAIDTWWREPTHDGAFVLDHPFLELPNVLGSPHNSGLVPGTVGRAVGRAAANVGRFLRGEPVHGVVHPEDYVDPSAAR